VNIQSEAAIVTSSLKRYGALQSRHRTTRVELPRSANQFTVLGAKLRELIRFTRE
jgi:hypothetical protein